MDYISSILLKIDNRNEAKVFISLLCAMKRCSALLKALTTQYSTKHLIKDQLRDITNRKNRVYFSFHSSLQEDLFHLEASIETLENKLKVTIKKTSSLIESLTQYSKINKYLHGIFHANKLFELAERKEFIYKAEDKICSIVNILFSDEFTNFNTLNIVQSEANTLNIYNEFENCFGFSFYFNKISESIGKRSEQEDINSDMEEKKAYTNKRKLKGFEQETLTDSMNKSINDQNNNEVSSNFKAVNDECSNSSKSTTTSFGINEQIKKSNLSLENEKDLSIKSSALNFNNEYLYENKDEFYFQEQIEITEKTHIKLNAQPSLLKNNGNNELERNHEALFDPSNSQLSSQELLLSNN